MFNPQKKRDSKFLKLVKMYYEKIKEKDLKEELHSNETLNLKKDDKEAKTFAIGYRAIELTLGKSLYDVQVIGGYNLSIGRIVEMRTGEGKTITTICPAIYNVIAGNKVHILTTNEYLAARDYEETKPVYELLGIDSRLVDSKEDTKKEGYKGEIVYSTASEVGFDYLRDNLVYSKEQKSQDRLDYVILDEADSTLLDEASTPLIIAGTGNPELLFKKYNHVIETLEEKFYEIDFASNTCYFNTEGSYHVSDIIGYDLTNKDHNLKLHVLLQLLKAHKLLKKDKDYIVDEDEIILIDSSTGRIADGRRFNEGLHQALEAKEGVTIKGDSSTIATITYQDLFRKYKKLSGMSGTIHTNKEEIQEIYQVDVYKLDTNKPIQRIDNKDRFFKTNQEKMEALIDEVKSHHLKGQPLLVCTQTISEAEELSEKLKKVDLKHRLLTARTNQEEAEIISQAGKFGAVTISTNIAGRGTDIKVDEEGLNAGGLYVIATSRSPLLRVDNQLIGRAGRQGQIGASTFFLSLEDDFYKHNLEEYTYAKLLAKPKLAEKLVSSVHNRVSGIEYSMRKSSLKYSRVLGLQRDNIYKLRDSILECGENKDYTGVIISKIVTEYVLKVTNELDFDADDREGYDELNLQGIADSAFKSIGMSYAQKVPDDVYDTDDFATWMSNTIIVGINNLLLVFADDLSATKFVSIIISQIDMAWRENLSNMEMLKLSAATQVYMQKDPVQYYELYSADVFQYTLDEIMKGTLQSIFLAFETREEIIAKVNEENSINSYNIDEKNEEDEEDEEDDEEYSN